MLLSDQRLLLRLLGQLDVLKAVSNSRHLLLFGGGSCPGLWSAQLTPVSPVFLSFSCWAVAALAAEVQRFDVIVCSDCLYKPEVARAMAVIMGRAR